MLGHAPRIVAHQLDVVGRTARPPRARVDRARLHRHPVALLGVDRGLVDGEIVLGEHQPLFPVEGLLQAVQQHPGLGIVGGDRTRQRDRPRPGDGHAIRRGPAALRVTQHGARRRPAVQDHLLLAEARHPRRAVDRDLTRGLTRGPQRPFARGGGQAPPGARAVLQPDGDDRLLGRSGPRHAPSAAVVRGHRQHHAVVTNEREEKGVGLGVDEGGSEREECTGDQQRGEWTHRSSPGRVAARWYQSVTDQGPVSRWGRDCYSRPERQGRALRTMGCWLGCDACREP